MVLFLTEILRYLESKWQEQQRLRSRGTGKLTINVTTNLATTFTTTRITTSPEPVMLASTRLKSKIGWADLRTHEVQRH